MNKNKQKQMCYHVNHTENKIFEYFSKKLRISCLLRQKTKKAQL